MGLVADPDARARLGAHGRRFCEERYDAVRQTGRLVELMREVAAARAARTA
jgi:hypothetical protein